MGNVAPPLRAAYAGLKPGATGAGLSSHFLDTTVAPALDGVFSDCQGYVLPTRCALPKLAPGGVRGETERP